MCRSLGLQHMGRMSGALQAPHDALSNGVPCLWIGLRWSALGGLKVCEKNSIFWPFFTQKSALRGVFELRRFSPNQLYFSDA